jgi:transcription initiation factor TFIIIB Brf1 subunit/transcription initiation factor TFIIB
MNNLEIQSFPKRRKKINIENIDINGSIQLKENKNRLVHSFPKKDDSKDLVFSKGITPLKNNKNLKISNLEYSSREPLKEIYNDQMNDDDMKDDDMKDNDDFIFENDNISLENKECIHSDTINSNGIDICIDCGLEISNMNIHDKEWRYYGDSDNINSSDPSRCQYRKKPEKGIKKELIKFGFPIDISELADQLYLAVTKGEIKRSNLRKGIMFACVFNAYKEKNNPQIPEELQKIFKIDRKNVSKGLTYFHLNSPYKTNSTYITIEDFIPKIMEKLKIKQQHIEAVLKLSKIIKNSSSTLIRSNPQSVSSSLVFYYLRKLNPDEINISEFSNSVKLSEITILRLMSEIESIIDNENNNMITA